METGYLKRIIADSRSRQIVESGSSGMSHNAGVTNEYSFSDHSFHGQSSPVQTASFSGESSLPVANSKQTERTSLKTFPDSIMEISGGSPVSNNVDTIHDIPAMNKNNSANSHITFRSNTEISEMGMEKDGSPSVINSLDSGNHTHISDSDLHSHSKSQRIVNPTFETKRDDATLVKGDHFNENRTGLSPEINEIVEDNRNNSGENDTGPNTEHTVRTLSELIYKTEEIRNGEEGKFHAPDLSRKYESRSRFQAGKQREVEHRIHIGQIDVVVETPVPPITSSPSKFSSGSDMSGRLYLRRL